MLADKNSLTRPIFPVYLNQGAVFDMVAMLQGGIATVTSVSHSASSGISSDESVSARFGLSEALSTLLRIDLSASGKTATHRDEDERRIEDRVHTPASLLHRLRQELFDRNIATRIDSSTILAAGDIVEFNGSLRRNSVVSAFSTMFEVMRLGMVLNQPAQKGSRDRKIQRQQDEQSRTKNQIEHFMESLLSSGTIDMISTNLPNNFQAVLTLEASYLSDKSMSDLVDGTFTILGKIIRTVHDERESISLLRKTPLAGMTQSALATFFGHFEELGETTTFQIPSIEWAIKGPVIHVLPIAVFA